MNVLRFFAFTSRGRVAYCRDIMHHYSGLLAARDGPPVSPSRDGGRKREERREEEPGDGIKGQISGLPRTAG